MKYFTRGGITAIGTVAALMAIVQPAEAQLLSVDLPDFDLQPNMPNQSFDLFIQNDGSAVAVNGITFNLQIGNDPSGVSDAPSIADVDVITDTIFDGNNTGEAGLGAITGQVYNRTTTTAGGTEDIPSGPSKLATVIFDTSGYFSGAFTYTLDTVNGPLKFNTSGSDIFPSLQGGTLTVIPEPGTTAMVAGALCLLGGVFIRKRKNA